MKKILLLLVWILFSVNLFGQMLQPVKWSYAAKKLNTKYAVVLIKATLEQGWHIYSVNQKDGGPLKTSFLFSLSTGYALIGKTIEPKPILKYDEAFGIDVNYFEKSVVFRQKIRIKKGETSVKGKVNFMVCNNQKCLPPDDVEFSIPVKLSL